VAGSFDQYQLLYVDGPPADPIRVGQMIVDLTEADPLDMLKVCTDLSPLTYESIHGGGGGGTVTQIDEGHGIVLTPDPITTTGEVAVDEAANFTWTGSHDFQLSLTSSGDNANPAQIVLFDNDAGSNEKSWFIRSNAGILSIYAALDATPGSATGAQSAILIDRTGVAVDSIEFRTANTSRLLIEADGAWNLAGDQGVNGEVLMSQGASLPPIWEPAGVITGRTFVYQEANLVITNNAAYQDTDLVATLTPGSYVVTAQTVIGVNATPDARMQMLFTGTQTFVYGSRMSAESGTTVGLISVAALPSETAVLTQTSDYVHFWFQFIEVTVTGDIKIQAKQNTSSGTAVTFRKGSYMQIVQVA
jgi:hypothetical protein